MQSAHVRRAVPADRAPLAALLVDMQAHYGSPNPPDLYVAAAARGSGAGAALLAAMARIALDDGYCRIDWTTDATNTGAQRLYDRLGVPRQAKCFYRLEGENLRRFAAA